MTIKVNEETASSLPTDRVSKDSSESGRRRSNAFCTKFAYPVTGADHVDRQCLVCRDEQSPLWRTYFEAQIPAFLCLPCIEAAYVRVTQFLREQLSTSDVLGNPKRGMSVRNEPESESSVSCSEIAENKKLQGELDRKND